jgi:hypothetical protein
MHASLACSTALSCTVCSSVKKQHMHMQSVLATCSLCCLTALCSLQVLKGTCQGVPCAIKTGTFPADEALAGGKRECSFVREYLLTHALGCELVVRTLGAATWGVSLQSNGERRSASPSS